MRRYLAYWPDEVPRGYRMLDLVARGAGSHSPVHLLLASAAEIGFAWDGGEQGWLRVALPASYAGWSCSALSFCRSAGLAAYCYYSASSTKRFSGGSVR